MNWDKYIGSNEPVHFPCGCKLTAKICETELETETVIRKDEKTTIFGIMYSYTGSKQFF